MAGGDEDTASAATIADRPALLVAVASPARGAAAPDSTPHTLRALPQASSPSALDRTSDPAGHAIGPASEEPDVAPTIHAAGPPTLVGDRSAPPGSPTTLTTAADALRNEEIDRTRLFIRMGWAISVAAIGSVPLLHAPRAMSLAFVVAMSLGIVVSLWFHHRFSDPGRYTEGALVVLAVMCLFNAHVAVLYYGTFTVTPIIVVIGIHFVARTEAERAARWIFATGIALYSVIAAAITSGVIDDPGVFASDRPIGATTRLAGAAFVLGTYTLAYVTARAFRKASLASIESLQRATRLASQREALMDELRLDLERALRVGGPGRYTEQTVGGYRLGAVLGRGAMGEVYEAVQLATGEPAAVKLLRRELLSDPTQVARFLREARASGALDSAHVVKILDAAERDPPYLAMERLYGQTLAERLRSDDRLAPAQIAELVRHVGAGLDAASRAGIIHRDIKPQNLLFDRTCRVWKILDFGVATLLDESSGTLTQGGIIGTPSYMAPEQAEGRRLDGRADLYALAAVAYRCATGRHPFSGADTPALLYAVVHKMPIRPGETASLPADVDRWFAIALAKAPDDRFATGAELAGALDAAVAGALDPKLRRRAEVLLRTLPWAS
ncbi:MAG TPA: serine/threonine-protein kinase [Kofleriaceae bacterium]|nr:serine/threonine-protein kinase [Kofleriaceae bacterium]